MTGAEYEQELSKNAAAYDSTRQGQVPRGANPPA